MAIPVANIGSLSIATYMRLAPGDGLDLANGTFTEPQFSKSPIREGARLVLDNVGPKELQIPLFLRDNSKDLLHDLVIALNRALAVDGVMFEWRDSGATQSSFFDVVSGRFEPETNFRRGERGWLGGILRLWVQPYAHTGTDRLVATAGGTGPMLVASAAGIDGDAQPLTAIKVTTGSSVPSQGRIVAAAVIPDGYVPRYPVASLSDLVASAAIFNGSGAPNGVYLSLPIAPDGASGVAAQIPLQAASAYRGGAHRVLAFARTGIDLDVPIRVHGPDGLPLGPTALIPAQDDWSLIDLGVLRLPDGDGPTAVKLPIYAGGRQGGGLAGLPRVHLGEIYILPEDQTAMTIDRAGATGYGDDSISLPISSFLTGRRDRLGQQWLQARAPGYGGLYGAYDVRPQFTGPAGNYLDRDPISDFDAAAAVDIALGDGGFAGHRVDIDASSWFDMTIARASNTLPFRLQITAVAAGATTLIASLAIPTTTAVVDGQLAARRVGGNARLNYVRNGSVIASCGASHALAAQPGQPGLIVNHQSVLFSLRNYAVGPIASNPRGAGDLYSFDGRTERVTRMDSSGGINGVLNGDTRGRVPALPALPAGRVAVLTSQLDQGGASDTMAVEIRARERFRFAR